MDARNETEKDTLAKLYEELDLQEKKIIEQKEYWNQKKLEALERVIEEQIQLNNDEKLAAHTEINALFETLKTFVQLPENNLRDLLQKKLPPLHARCLELIKDFQELAKHDPDSDQNIRLDICTKMIDNLDDVQAMINAIKVELDYCTRFRHVGTQLLIWMAELLVNSLIQNNVPSPQLDLEALERAMLNEEVRDQVKHINDEFVGTAEAVEAIAKEKIEPKKPAPGFFSGWMSSAAYAVSYAKSWVYPSSSSTTEKEAAPAQGPKM